MNTTNTTNTTNQQKRWDTKFDEIRKRVLNQQTWTCTKHGVLSISATYTSDRFYGRHRCKVCANATNKKYLDKAQGVRIWRNFVRRMRRQGHLCPLPWKGLGQDVLQPVISILKFSSPNKMDNKKIKLNLSSKYTVGLPITKADILVSGVDFPMG